MKAPDVTAIVKGPRLDGVKAEIEAARTPREAKAALTKAEAIRDMLNKAMDLAGEEAPHLRQLHREAEQVSLNAMVRLGALVPANEPRRPAAGEEVFSLKTFADSVGVSVSAAHRLRKLSESFSVYPDHFAAIVDRALSAGQPVPLGKLRKLADPDIDPDTLMPDAEKPPKSDGQWLAEAAKHAMRAREMCEAIAGNTKAPPDVRAAAKAYAEGVARFCGELRRSLNAEVL